MKLSNLEKKSFLIFVLRANLLAAIGLFFIISANSCGIYNYPANHCEDKKLDSATIKQSTLTTIPLLAYHNVHFSNNNGFHDNFYSNDFKNFTVHLNVNIYDYAPGDPMEECYEYYEMPLYTLTYTALTSKLEISYIFRKNISYPDNYSWNLYSNLYQIDVDTIPDILVVKISNSSMYFQLETKNRTELTNSFEILDSMTLNLKQYYNVFHSYDTIASNYLKVTDMFYTKEKGLIGFNLSNKEQWYID